MKAVNMSRRRLVQALPAGLAAPVLAAPAGGPRPNFLFILVDDMEYQLFQSMTKVRRLVTQRGMEFRNHFVTLALCCASRATILRGQYGHNHGVRDNHGPYGGFEKFFKDGLDASTIATWLQAAGYRTGLIGKYLNTYEAEAPHPNYIPPGWNTWLSPNGGDEYRQLNYSVNDNGNTVEYGHDPKDHFHDLLTTRANRFLREAAKDPSSKPFFLYLAPYLPHGPSLAPARYLDLLPDVKLPRPPSFNEADVSDKPGWLRRLPLLDSARIAQIRRFYRRQLQAALALDDMVESVVRTLQATGQLSNTFIVFTSDNGYFHGEHRIPGDKKRAYEESIHVPLVVCGPGIPAGRVVTQLTSNVDFAPTLAALAGVAPPGFVDGRSLVPLLRGRTPARWRQALLLESQPPEVNSVYQSYVGLRTQTDRTLVLWDYGFREFYELKTDPYQLQNRYTAMPEPLRMSLLAQLRSLRNAGGATLRRAEEVAAG
ncbi:sulfatase [uncultured Azohydromonas sp.]|jgi:Arylsulfatase A and related enzymes|uniref:sulfatase family protein n=1 Tax=uncultured Azohydromonas sp. TaxID=487342 RepID=UPI00262E33D8|nr:sulfatase [uncultured Azohydromonas sp.]